MSDGFGGNFIGGFGGLNGIPANIIAQYPNYLEFANYVNGQFGGSTQWNWQLFDTLYRTSWVAEKCVTILADDMTDKWRIFEHDDPEVVKIRQAYEEENEIAETVHAALMNARLYGGSAILPILHSQFNDESFKKPFLPQSVQKDDLHGFQVLSKFDLTPLAGINRDVFQSPKVFGDYIYYKIIRIQTIIDASVSTVTEEPVNSTNLPTIHTTRMVKFYGKELLYYQKFFSGGWGDSILTPLIDKIPAIEEAFHLVYLYMDLFNVDEIKIPNLTAIVNSGAGAQLFKNYTAFRDRMRAAKLRFMDANDEMNRNQLGSLHNIVPVAQSNLQFVVAATGIPLTRFLGTSVGGFSTGDNELTQYYDLVNQQQKRLSYQLKVMDEIIERSIFGKKMDIKYRFAPKRDMTEKERAERDNMRANTFSVYMQNRVMTPQVVAENIQKDFEGLDQHYITSLEEDFIDYENNYLYQEKLEEDAADKGDTGIYDEIPDRAAQGKKDDFQRRKAENPNIKRTNDKSDPDIELGQYDKKKQKERQSDEEFAEETTVDQGKKVDEKAIDKESESHVPEKRKRKKGEPVEETDKRPVDKAEKYVPDVPRKETSRDIQIELAREPV